MSRATYSNKLQCTFNGWRVRPDDPDAEITLYMPDRACCDMGGAIEIAKKIIPNVQRIVTVAGDRPDTEYRLSMGKWEARPAERFVGEGKSMSSTFENLSDQTRYLIKIAHAQNMVILGLDAIAAQHRIIEHAAQEGLGIEAHRLSLHGLEKEVAKGRQYLKVITRPEEISAHGLPPDLSFVSK